MIVRRPAAVTHHLGLVLVILTFLAGSLAATPAWADLSGSVFSGVLQDSSGVGVSQVALTLTGSNGQASFATTTGADGSFSLSVPSDTYAVNFEGGIIGRNTPVGSAVSGFRFHSTGLDLTLGSLTAQVLTLPALVNVDVVVSDSTGNPVVGAVVSTSGVDRCHNLPPLGGLATTAGESFESLSQLSGGFLSDGTGTAVLPVLPCAQTDGILVNVAPPVGSNLSQASIPLTVASIQSDTTIPVTLDGAKTFSGVLQDSSGVGVSQVALTLTGSNGQASFATTTGADGSFSLSVPSDTYAVNFEGGIIGRNTPVGSAVSGFRFHSTGLDLTLGSLTAQVLTLPALVNVDVVVSDSTGNPVVGAVVSTSGVDRCHNLPPLGGLATTAGESFESLSQLSGGFLSDGTGTAVLPVLPCAQTDGILVNVAPPVGSNLSQASIPLTVASIQSDTTIPVTLDGAKTFSGVLQDSSGVGVSQVALTLTGSNGQASFATTTGADGSFSLSVPSDTYAVNFEGGIIGRNTPVGSAVSGFRFHSTGLDLTLGSLTAQVLTLPALVNVDVVVSDSTGNPVVGAVVSTSGVDRCHNLPLLGGLATTAGESFESLSQLSGGFLSDGTGTAVLPVLPCAQTDGILVNVAPPVGSNLSQASIPLTVASIQSDTTIPVTLASLRGTVVDGDGIPLSGQTVNLRSANGGTTTQQGTSDNGNFALTAPADNYTVGLSGSVGDPTTYAVTVPGFDLTSPRSLGSVQLPTMRTTVAVTGPGGSAVANASLLMACATTSFPLLGGTASGTQCATETTNGAGTATLEFLPTATITLTVSAPAGLGLSPQTLMFTPHGGGLQTVSLAGPKSPILGWPAPTSIVYGTPLGGQQLDATASVPGTFTYSPSARTILAAGPHPVTATFTPTDSTLYSAATITATVQVKAAPLVVTASSSTGTYGQPVPAVTPNFRGFIGAEGPADLTSAPTCQSTNTSSLPAVGAYVTSCSGGGSSNYQLRFVNGHEKVNQAALTIKASTRTAVYGLGAPGTFPVFTGFVAGQTANSLAVAPTCTAATASPNPSVGSYPTTCTGAVAPNYAIKYVHGTMQITPAPLTTTAINATRSVGNGNPKFTSMISGFVLGQTSSTAGVAGTATCKTTATAKSPVGTYPITCSRGSLTANNYQFTLFVTGTLTITRH